MQPVASQEPTLDRKILASPVVRLRLIAVSGAILIAGSALAPARQEAPSRTEERANPLIEEQVAAAAPVVGPFSGVQAAAEISRAHVIEIQPARPALRHDVASDIPARAPAGLEGAGVMVSDGHVLTHATALDGRLAVRVAAADGRSGDAVVAAYDPATGLVLLRSTPGLATPAILASTPSVAGSLTVAVGHVDRRPIAVPAFIAVAGEARVTVTPVGPGTAPGLPVFTLEGALVGVMGAPESGDVAVATGVVDRLIARAAAGDVPRSFGLAVQRLDGALARAFGTKGVLVSEVVPAGPAAMAGLAAGDVLVRVGETRVDSLEAASAALRAAANAPVATLRVVRRGRERTVEAAAVSSYTTTHLARVDPARATTVFAGVVLPPPLLTALGLPADAQVLSINGMAAATRAQATRALAGGRAVDILHVRDDRGAYFVAIEAVR